MVTRGLPTLIRARWSCEKVESIASSQSSCKMQKALHRERNRVCAAIKRKVEHSSSENTCQPKMPILRAANEGFNIKRDCFFCTAN